LTLSTERVPGWARLSHQNMPYRQTMAAKKRSFKDAFEGAFNTILDVHEKQLNQKNVRADLKKKALEKRIRNLQEEIKKLQEQACNDEILADAIQVHDPRQMVNLLQVIEEVIRNADFERTSKNFRKKERCDNGAGAVVTLGLTRLKKVSKFSTKLDAGQQLMIYLPELLKSIDPDQEYESCSISLNAKFKEHTDDYNAKKSMMITCGSVKDSGLFIKINGTTKLLNTYYKPHYFDGQNPHWSKDWQSDDNRDRISLVFYTRGKKQDRQDISEDGSKDSEDSSQDSEDSEDSSGSERKSKPSFTVGQEVLCIRDGCSYPAKVVSLDPLWVSINNEWDWESITDQLKELGNLVPTDIFDRTCPASDFPLRINQKVLYVCSSMRGRGKYIYRGYVENLHPLHIYDTEYQREYHWESVAPLNCRWPVSGKEILSLPFSEQVETIEQWYEESYNNLHLCG